MSHQTKKPRGRAFAPGNKAAAKPPEKVASAHIHLRVTRGEKSALVRRTQSLGQTLKDYLLTGQTRKKRKNKTKRK